MTLIAEPHGSGRLSARGLRVSTNTAPARTLVADLDLDVHEGEAVAIVGESGSGKSLTARSLIGLPPDGVSVTGDVHLDEWSVLDRSERDLVGVRGRDIGLVMQDPFTALNPLRTCGKHIVETLRGPGGRRLSRQQRRQEAVRRLAEVGIRDPGVADRHPFQISGGMRQRVAIAAALAQQPKFLIADEPTTALDTIVQEEILQLLSDLRRTRGMGLLLITHDLRIAFSMCDRVYVMYAGQVVEAGPSSAMFAEPTHPYTLGLLTSDPPVDRRLQRLASIEGSVPPADDVLSCCPFLARCNWAASECEVPVVLRDADGIETACVRRADIQDDLRGFQKKVHNAVDTKAPPPSTDALLSVSRLTKRFRRSSSLPSFVAVDEVDLTVNAGECVGLVGESGSGKSTLARCIVGLEQPSDGRIEITGIDAGDYSRVSRPDLRRLRHAVQYIFQDPYSSLNPARTIGATLAEAVSQRSDDPRDIPQQVHRLLDQVGLPESYTRLKPGTLSGGERQRIAIARAFAVRPAAIVCDEPVSALDVSVQAHVVNLMRSLRDETGVAYLFIAHDLAIIRQLVDRVYVMERGKIVEHGPTADVLDNPQHPYTQRLRAAVPALPNSATVVETDPTAAARHV